MAGKKNVVKMCWTRFVKTFSLKHNLKQFFSTFNVPVSYQGTAVKAKSGSLDET